jgi:hypothetical protein
MHRGMLALVTVMTLMIVVCLGFLGYGLSTQAGRLAPAAEASINLPAEGMVKMMSAYKGGIALYVAEKDGDKIYLIDAKTGKEQGKIAVKKDKAN